MSANKARRVQRAIHTIYRMKHLMHADQMEAVHAITADMATNDVEALREALTVAVGAIPQGADIRSLLGWTEGSVGPRRGVPARRAS